ESMFLSRVAGVVRKLVGRCPEGVLRGLHPPDELRRILERERARADRTGDSLSLLTFTPRFPEGAFVALASLAKVLRQRLRATDEVGWLDDRRIGAVLPNTSARGAWKVADDIALEYPADLPLPVCTVYSYPSDP